MDNRMERWAGTFENPGKSCSGYPGPVPRATHPQHRCRAPDRAHTYLMCAAHCLVRTVIWEVVLWWHVGVAQPGNRAPEVPTAFQESGSPKSPQVVSVRLLRDRSRLIDPWMEFQPQT